MYRDGLLDPLCGLIMGETAENLVDMYDISREEQDEFALESQRKARAGSGRRAAEMFPVEATLGRADRHGRRRRASAPRRLDGRPRRSSTRCSAKEAASRPATRAGITDGAAALVLMSESRARAEGRRDARRASPRCRGQACRPRSWASGRCLPPSKVMERLGCAIDDFELIEINEAFAAQVIACERELKFDRDRLNVNGGGISVGHPIGMSGARIIARPRVRDARARPVAGARDPVHLRRPGAGRRAGTSLRGV